MAHLRRGHGVQLRAAEARGSAALENRAMSSVSPCRMLTEALAAKSPHKDLVQSLVMPAVPQIYFSLDQENSVHTKWPSEWLAEVALRWNCLWMDVSSCFLKVVRLWMPKKKHFLKRLYDKSFSEAIDFQ